MRAVVQRVSEAQVTIDAGVVGKIGRGLLVYAAAAPDDGEADVRYVADKVAQLRVFPDDAGKMNLDVRQAGGGVLLVSAFTAHADARKGRRPSFDTSASGDVAAPLIERLGELIREHEIETQTGRFAAYMQVASVNDGPICVLLDSRRLF
jgi:D-tyrosyl-tRNA(Tyr) deacylase